jgi:hypothetical protein
MFATFLSLALFIAPAIQGALAEFAISTPALTQCKDARISWEKTEGPYNLIIVKPEDPCGDPILDLGDHDGTVLNWKVTLPAGIEVQLSLEDKDGDEAWSGKITVGDSDDASCVDPKLAKSDKSTKPTTLVVPPTTPAAAATTSATVAPVGAANAGNSPFGSTGAATKRHISTPLMALSAVFAVIALAL